MEQKNGMENRKMLFGTKFKKRDNVYRVQKE